MHARHSRYRETAPHNADGNAKHESFLAMHYLTFIGYRSLMARKMLTLHRYTLTATIHCNAQAHFGGALGGKYCRAADRSSWRDCASSERAAGDRDSFARSKAA